jgi:phospho-N-acetylmuramoyl-pentapeptide-transferase
MPLWIQITVPLLSFLLSAAIGTVLIPQLKKLGMRQTINKYITSIDGKKQGTPMMGGFMFIIASIVALAVGMVLYIVYGGTFSLRSDNNDLYKLIAGLVFALLNSSLGFADDYTKAVRKKNDGISMRQKLIPQFIFAGAFVWALWLLGDKSTAVYLPFFGSLELSYFYFPLMVCFAVYLTNAVNLTDGVDGLCGSMTVIAGLALAMLSTKFAFPEYTLFSLAVSGACLGFLVHNFHPAKVFMGDTGSMYLGAFITAVGFVLHQHFLLIVVALVYIIDALTVLIQRLYFKLTHGKRLLPKTPIHHGFQEMGFSDEKVTIMFTAATLLCGIAAYLFAIYTPL